jgi:hypothetical protein
MFTRTHHVGRYAYTEALQSYRDPNTKQPKHRCIARWPANHSLADELRRARTFVDDLQSNIAYWQGVIDRTVPPPRRPFHPRRARRVLAWYDQRLPRATARLAALQAASDGLAPGLPQSLLDSDFLADVTGRLPAEQRGT